MNNYLENSCYFCHSAILSSRAACNVHFGELQKEWYDLKIAYLNNYYSQNNIKWTPPILQEDREEVMETD